MRIILLLIISVNILLHGNTKMTVKAAAINKLTFEQALAELESIVSTLERGNAGLDEAMEIYTRGQQLKEHCNIKLAGARLQVEQVKVENGEGVGVTDFKTD